MERRVAPENLAGMINVLMRQNQLTVGEVRRRLNGRSDPIPVHGTGKFHCSCKAMNVWSSPFSWISVDLMEQQITKRWRMKCAACRTALEPSFSLDQAEKMVRVAIRLFKGEPRPSYGPRIRHERPDPHLTELCEKCGWGSERCWRAPAYRPPRPAPAQPPAVNGNNSTSELGDTDHTSTDSEWEGSLNE